MKMRIILGLAALSLGVLACCGNCLPPALTSTGPDNTTVLLTPTNTPTTQESLLADLPLGLNATWVYSAEIDYENPKDPNNSGKWTGTITDRVVAMEVNADGNLVFTLQEEMEPLPPQEVWNQPLSFKYILSGNVIYRDAVRVYQWPLSNGLTWKAFENVEYFWSAAAVETVVTPYGELHGCFVLTLVTNPDTSQDTFCPRVGFVEHTYMHHGTLQNEHFILVEFRAGK
jgi:hypothetical protein